MPRINDIILEIEKWIFENFSQKINSDERYIDSGAIDSFDMIVLVDFIEENYQIKFSADDFQDTRFFTIKGLAELIIEKPSDV